MYSAPNNMLIVTVPGEPQGKGSKRLVTTKAGKSIMLDDNHEGLRQWESLAVDRLQTARTGSTWDGPCSVAINVHLRRPKAHYYTGKRANVLRPDAPNVPPAGRDIDKIARATLDCLTTAGVFTDDRRVAELYVRRHWADAQGPRTVIAVREMTAGA